MTNLLSETIEAIRFSGHEISRVVFIGSVDGKYRCNWAEFRILADREYDAGSGSSEVAVNLIVLFSDGKKLWRREYGDGSEGWEFDETSAVDYTLPGLPITNLIGEFWPSLAEMNTGTVTP